MHVIAAKAVAFKEAASKEFKVYQKQVIDNARVMAKVLPERGLRIVSGRTDSHVFLVDLRAKNLTGKDAEAALGRAHITVNKNAIPNDPQKPFVTSGIRIGTPGDDHARLQGTGSGETGPPDCRRAGCAERRRGDRARDRRCEEADRTSFRCMD